MKFYPDETEFGDRKDCPSCHRLQGLKINKFWPSGPDNVAMRLMWTCESCHIRKWEVVPYAETDMTEMVCELCAVAFDKLYAVAGAWICEKCREIVGENV
jgi:C4-type Zn-finger protein